MVESWGSKHALVWSFAIAILVAVASLLGLFGHGIYDNETLNWTIQARGQDMGNLLAIAVLLVSGFRFQKGSFKASLIWIGTLFYLIYAYMVYGFAVHFNRLFLVYVAVLGLSIFAVIMNIDAIRARASQYPNASAHKFAALALAGVGILFALLWLSEIIPALLAGTTPDSLKEAELWVNPIHVIDLSTVLPAFVLTGYLALKGKPSGLVFISPWLAFSVLMGLSIVAAMILMAPSGGFASVLPPMIMVSLVVVVSFFALWRYVRAIV